MWTQVSENRWEHESGCFVSSQSMILPDNRILVYYVPSHSDETRIGQQGRVYRTLKLAQYAIERYLWECRILGQYKH